MQMKDSDLRKRKVMTADGKEIGVGAGVAFDTDSMKVVALHVRLHAEAAKQIGAKRPLLGKAELSLAPEDISGIADAVILRLTLAQLGRQG